MTGPSSLVRVTPAGPLSLDELRGRVLRGELGPDPAQLVVSVGFVTSQGARHVGRSQAYRNEILSLRVEAAVGSCGVEPGELTESAGVVDECVAAPVNELLEHPVLPVRVAALDAYLMHVSPHPGAGGVRGTPIVVPAGSSLDKSRARARAVVDLLPVTAGQRVLVVGVVNSLLAQLRERGIDYVPCDLAGGHTEWGEPVCTGAVEQIAGCDALLVTGMSLGNGSFDTLLAHARSAGRPVVMFAQSGSAVLPWFLGAPGLHAVSAEPYPFFSLDGGPSRLFHYRFPEAA